MASPQLVYCVEDIFGQCLHDYEVEKFRIAAYQRGYKWESEVDKLLSDLHEAFGSVGRATVRGEYYLQYVTLKKQAGADGTPSVLDVIDGQQRLTTLSLFFAVLGHVSSLQTGFTEWRLEYAVRENFLEEFVYAGHVEKLLLSVTDERKAWPEFVAQHPAYDRQDVWYLFKAARKIRDFFSQEEKRGLVLADFGNYVAGRVMLIVNLVEGRVSSEKVFRNLNSIKVELTETELLKGLLLTKVAREPGNSHHTPTPREVVEIRSSMGRQWDEMARWLNRPAVAGFFKPAGLAAEPGISLFPLLRLVALHDGYSDAGSPVADGRYPVFKYLQKSIRNGRPAADYFDRLRLLFALLRDWYERPETHNLLGFLLFSKGQGNKPQLLRKITDEAWLTDVDIEADLREQISKLDCLGPDPIDLRYGQNDAAIHDLLLLVNVFPKRPQQTAPIKFDFARFGSGSWSLEHIFPQNPELNKVRALGKPDQLLVLQLVEPAHQKTVRKLLAQKGPASDQEKEQFKESLKLDRLLLHGAGNLALLERGQNSSLNNALFDEKRRRIVELISRGEFVPPHTFNLFSRLLLATGSKSTSLWAKEDMQAHSSHMSKEWSRLVNHFKPLPQ